MDLASTTTKILFDRQFLFGIFSVAILVFAVVSWMLLYHWHEYAFDRETLGRMRGLYFVGAIICIVLMLAGIIMMRP